MACPLYLSLSLVFCLLAFPFSSIQASHFAIICHGPSIPVEQLKQSIGGRTIIALDGGATTCLKEYQLYPHIILGDFDSIEDKNYWGIVGTFDEIDEQTEPYMGHFGILIVPAKDQNYTDLEKGIMYCDKQGAQSILILNAIGGGRMDHTLGNIGLLRKYYKRDRPITLQTETEKIEYVRDASTTIKGKIGDNCAILGYPEAIMSTQGLAYNGTQYPLKLGIQESVCNKLAEPQATVLIQGEALVIHPHP